MTQTFDFCDLKSYTKSTFIQLIIIYLRTMKSYIHAIIPLAQSVDYLHVKSKCDEIHRSDNYTLLIIFQIPYHYLYDYRHSTVPLMSTESKTMFNRRVFLLILTGVVLASAGFIGDPQALLNNRRSRFNWSDGRIVGGNTADPGQFSHQISQRLFGIYHLCSGSIISNRWIVTAAQCTYGWPMDYLSIVAGAHHISADGYSYEISAIIVHHEYDDENLFNDISLIQVQRPFLLSDRVAIIGFGSAEPIGVGIAARASGWGSLEVS